VQGNIIKKRLMSFAFEKTPRISLSCSLVSVQYLEYKYGIYQDLLSRDYHSLFPMKFVVILNRKEPNRSL